MHASVHTRQVQVSLYIPADEYLRVYQGSAKRVSALDNHGRRVHFPVSILQPFITREGIEGAFVIHTDHHNRFVKIEKVA